MRRPARLVLLGHPVGRSLSPTFQNAALRAAAIPLRYEALDLEPAAFDSTVTALIAERAAGNVTVPYKERMSDRCDRLTPLAARAGAVNVFWVDDGGRLVGDNSDVGGFDTAIAELLGERPRGMSVGILGAGGAAAAVLAAVESWPGCDAHVYNRTPERAAHLCERFRSIARAVDDVGVIAGAQLVVNATSVGLRDDAMPLDPALIAPGSAVLDLVYRRGATPWVRALRSRGHRANDGLGMLIEQGALAFEKWFAVSADRGAMWASVINAAT
jgi:shikimate dehydrogenase